ncbi:hypothetical protein H9Y04_12390 [Streptomyces sp. TRM66268-LWL]|uniref:Uncharacterized protein n=1 Tax=Streptomyces polyasparticus TaxID=2767826 RepID=A0ABR7SEG6_9ACTN|nr:hypothetical protein [Streptomyces polyasparticus]
MILIGGRSGVGKSSVGYEVSALLRAASVAHALIEGDVLDHIHPAPPGDPDRSEITARNLAALWANYTELGCRRLIYTNTAAVLDGSQWLFERALGPAVRMHPVLLTASDETAAVRLGRREIGSELEQQLRRSAHMARRLEEHAAPGTVRVATDARSVTEVAREVIAAAGW